MQQTVTSDSDAMDEGARRFSPGRPLKLPMRSSAKAVTINWTSHPKSRQPRLIPEPEQNLVSTHGDAAETSAGWALQSEGFEILGSIQRIGGNQGIDLVTVKDGQYHVFEVKGTFRDEEPPLSEAQESGPQFIMTRVRDALVEPEKFDARSVELAKALWNEPPDHIHYGKFDVHFER